MDQKADKHGAYYLFFVVSICIICVCLHASSFYFVCFVVMWINSSRNILDLEMVENAFVCAPSGSLPHGWRYSHFFFIRKLGPRIYYSSPKNIKNIKHPKGIFEILASPQNINHSVP